MKKKLLLITSIVSLFSLGACSNCGSKAVDGNWVEGDKKLVIEGDEAIISTYGIAETGKVNTSNQTILFTDDDGEDLVANYTIVGNTLALEINDVTLSFERSDKTTSSTESESEEVEVEEVEVTQGSNIKKTAIKESPDKNTFYIKDYVGRNASTCGSERMNGYIMDSYGKANLTIIFISENGEVVDEENREQYVVIDQHPEPNTELKLTFETDNEDTVKTQNIEDIELYVKKIQ